MWRGGERILRNLLTHHVTPSTVVFVGNNASKTRSDQMNKSVFAANAAKDRVDARREAKAKANK